MITHLGWLLLAAGLCCPIGCTALRLRQRTIDQANTLPELQYQQVLNNLARVAVNPSILPCHVNFKEGTSQITDNVSIGALVDLGPPAATEPQLFGSRTVVAQWGMEPIINPSELRLLQIAYRRAHGFPETPSPEFLEELAHELKDQFALNADLRYESAWFYELHSRASKTAGDLEDRIRTTNDERFCNKEGAHGDQSPLARNVCRKIEEIQHALALIQTGWFHVGCKREIPKIACYVGKSGTCYTWVGPDGYKELTEFTLTVLKLSSLFKEEVNPAGRPGSVKFSPGERGG